MPAITLYDASVPVFTKALKSLDAILDKGIAFAKEKGTDADDFVQARLIEDMLPLAFQVQFGTTTVKKAMWRLTGEDTAGAWEDDEKTMAELKARIAKTLDLLGSIKPEAVNGREDVQVELQLGARGSVFLPARDYLFNYALTNVFFHVQTTYSILRSKGVPLGKTDYQGPFMSEFLKK